MSMRPLASADSLLQVLLFWSSEGACKVWVAKFGLVSNAFLSNTIHTSPWVTTGWQDHVPSCYVARWSHLRNPSVSWAPGQNYCTWLGWVGSQAVVYASWVVNEWLERMNSKGGQAFHYRRSGFISIHSLQVRIHSLHFYSSMLWHL